MDKSFCFLNYGLYSPFFTEKIDQASIIWVHPDLADLFCSAFAKRVLCTHILLALLISKWNTPYCLVYYMCIINGFTNKKPVLLSITHQSFLVMLSTFVFSTFFP